MNTALRTPSIFSFLGFVLALGALEPARAQVTTVTIPASRDTTIYSENGNLSNGRGDFIFAGRTAQLATRRALLGFDVAAAIPAGSTIARVELVLEMNMTVAGPVPVELRRALANWGEGASNAAGQEGSGTQAQTNDATWTHRFFPATTWTTNGGDFSGTPSAVTSVDQAGSYSWVDLALANDVQSWLNAPATNFGWVVVGTETGPATAKRFLSRNSTTLGPRLVVDYTPPLVPANYCVATPNSTGLPGHLAASAPPTLSSGTLPLVASDLPPTAPCTFFFGSDRVETPLGNGNLCVAGQLFRFGTSIASGGVATRSLAYGSFPGNVIAPGTTWCFQAQYRNAAAGGAGFNQTDGLAVTFAP
jgi:hypothetical protein